MKKRNYFINHLWINCGLFKLPNQKFKAMPLNHNDVIKWKHFPRYWPFVREIHRSWVNSPHKGQWRRALMFSLICAWINRWINNPEAGDLRRHRAHHDVTVMHFRTIWSLLSLLALHHNHFDGLAQDCSNSIANALELLKSCTKPSICSYSFLATTMAACPRDHTFVPGAGLF